VKENISIHCTAGVTPKDMVRSLSGYGKVWCHKTRIETIMPLSQVCNKGQEVTFSSKTDNRFTDKKAGWNSYDFQALITRTLLL
jgi:hypothetical protein